MSEPTGDELDRENEEILRGEFWTPEPGACKTEGLWRVLVDTTMLEELDGGMMRMECADTMDARMNAIEQWPREDGA
jgi:hypothetical protein